MLELENAYEWESDLEDYESDGEWEYDGEYEDDDSELFFKRIGKRLRNTIKKVVHAGKKIAPIAARVVASAVGGPRAGSLAGRVVKGLTREYEDEFELDGEFEDEFELDGEFEDEYEYEDEYELDGEFESEYELDGEFEYDSNSEAEAMVADILADAASRAANEAEAEAYAGAATATALKPKSASMQKVTPYVVKGAAKLTKTLRKSSSTRPLVKMVPTIARLTNKTLGKQAVKGKKITRPLAAKVMATHTKKVLSNPKTCAKTLVKASRKLKTRQTRKKAAKAF